MKFLLLLLFSLLTVQQTVVPTLSCTNLQSLQDSACNMTFSLNSTFSNISLTVKIENFTNTLCGSSAANGYTCNATSSVVGSITTTTLTYFITAQNTTVRLPWTTTNPTLNGTYELTVIGTRNGNVAMDFMAPTIIITPQTVSATCTPANHTVGATTTYTIVLTPSTRILNNSNLFLTFPQWSPISTFWSDSTLSCNIAQCFFRRGTVLNFNKTLEQSTSLTIILYNIKNPSSTKPQLISGVLTLGGVYASFSFNVTATNLATISSTVVEGYNTSASAQSAINITFYLSMYCNQSAKIRITYDKSLSLSSGSSISTVTTTSNTSIVTGVCSSSSVQFTIVNLTVKNPVVSRNITMKFTTFDDSSGTAYDIENSSYMVELLPNKLLSLSGSLSERNVSMTNVSLTLNFTLRNALTGNGSYYAVQMASGFTSTGINCTDASTNAKIICSLNVSSMVVTVNLTENATKTVYLTIIGLTNPRYFETSSSSTFRVTTYGYDQDGLYPIDYETYNVSLVAKTFSPTVTSDNNMVGASATITVNINTNVLAGETLILQAPPDVKMLNDSCKWSNSRFQCTITSNASTYIISFLKTNPTYITTSSGQQFPAMSIIQTSTNKTNSNMSIAYYPAVTETAPMNIKSISQSNSVVGSMSNLTIDLKTSVSYTDGDIVEVTFPDVFCMTNISVARVVSTSQNRVNVTVSSGSTHQLTIQHRNYYSAANKTLQLKSYTNVNGAWAQRESGSSTVETKATELTIQDPGVRLMSSNNIRLNISYPFVVPTTVNLRIRWSSPDLLNITSCYHSQLGNCSGSPNTYLISGVDTSTVSKVDLKITTNYFQNQLIYVDSYVNGSELVTYNAHSIPLVCNFKCWTCDTSPEKCLSCFNFTNSPYPYFNPSDYTCSDSCSAGTYPDGYTCLKCHETCVTCTDAVSCTTCIPQFTKTTSGLCELICSAQCKTCAVTKDNCTSCHTGILYQGNCINECPDGTVLNEDMGTCQTTKVAYFPFLIVAGVLCLTGLGSKIIEPTTDVITSCVAFLGLMQFGCMVCLFLYGTGYPYILLLGLVCTGCQLAINCIALILYLVFLRKQPKFNEWQESSVKNKISLYVVLLLSLLSSFKLFRILYSRFLGRQYFSASFNERDMVIPMTNILTGIQMLTFGPLALTIAGLIMSKVSVRMNTKPQLFILCAQLIILTLLSFVFILLDLKKPEDYFGDRIANKMPIYNEQANNTMQTMPNIITLQQVEEPSDDPLKDDKADGDKSPKTNRFKKNYKNDSPLKSSKLSQQKGNSSRRSPDEKKSPGDPKIKTQRQKVTPRDENKDVMSQGLILPFKEQVNRENEESGEKAVEEFDKQTVINRRDGTIEVTEGEQKKEIEHTTRINQDVRPPDSIEQVDLHPDVAEFRRTAEISVHNQTADGFRRTKQRKLKKEPQINDIYLGFMNESDNQDNGVRPQVESRRYSRESFPIKTIRQRDSIEHLASRESECSDFSILDNFNSRIGPSDFMISEMARTGHSDHFNKRPIMIEQEPSGMNRRRKSQDRPKLKKTKDIYLNKNVAYEPGRK